MTEQAPQKDNWLAELPIVVELAAAYGLPPAVFVTTFRAMAMPAGHSEAEFVSSCLVVREHGLSPITKEIYFSRDKDGRLQAIVGVDGWIKKCNAHEQFDGMEFSEARDDKGKISAMTCSIYRKDRSRPTTITEYFEECVQLDAKGEPFGVWKTHPARQLRTRSLCQCARLAFGFAGIMEKSEFEQWQQASPGSQPTRPVRPAPAPVAVEVPEVPPDDAPVDVPIPDDEVTTAVALSASDEERELSDIVEAIQEAQLNVVVEILDGNADTVAALSGPGKQRLEEEVVGKILKSYTQAKSKKKAVKDAALLLDHLSDPARRTVEAIFNGGKS